jgi:hypothetical protein
MNTKNNSSSSNSSYEKSERKGENNLRCFKVQVATVSRNILKRTRAFIKIKIKNSECKH